MKELQRVPSPDGVVDAVLVMRPTAVVAPDVYEVYVVPHNQMPADKYMVLRGDEFENPRAVWGRHGFSKSTILRRT